MAKKNRGLVAMKPDQEWRAEDDLRTMMECAKIENDPKRLAAAKSMAQKKLMDLAGIASETE